MISIKNIVIYIYLIFLFLSSQPFFIWNSPFALVSVLGLVIAPLLWQKKWDNSKSICLVLIFVCYLYFSLYQASEAPARNLFGYIVALLSPTIFLIKKEYWQSIYEKYCLFFAISIIPSLVVYFLVVWGEVSLPFKVIEPLNHIKNYNYFQYPFCVIPEGLLSLRFHGYYDEPGVVGSIVGIFLIINKWDLKDWKNWPILIAGIFSFSFFFYLLSILYFLLFSPSKKAKFAFFSIILIVSFALYENEDINQLIFARMEIEDGELAGDNRTTASFDAWYDDYIQSDKVLIGYGSGKSHIVNFGGASYKDLIVDYGIIVNAVFYLTIMAFYYLRYGMSKETLICILCFLSMMYQRPFITSMFYLFLIIAPLYNITSEHRLKYT